MSLGLLVQELQCKSSMFFLAGKWEEFPPPTGKSRINNWDLFLYRTCLYSVIIDKFTIFACSLNDSKTLVRVSLGLLTYKYHSMMCSNEFAYHWNQFCLYSVMFDKVAIFSPPPPLRGLKTFLRGTVVPLTYKYNSMMRFNDFKYHWDQF